MCEPLAPRPDDAPARRRTAVAAGRAVTPPSPVRPSSPRIRMTSLIVVRVARSTLTVTDFPLVLNTTVVRFLPRAARLRPLIVSRSPTLAVNGATERMVGKPEFVVVAAAAPAAGAESTHRMPNIPIAAKGASLMPPHFGGVIGCSSGRRAGWTCGRCGPARRVDVWSSRPAGRVDMWCSDGVLRQSGAHAQPRPAALAIAGRSRQQPQLAGEVLRGGEVDGLAQGHAQRGGDARPGRAALARGSVLGRDRAPQRSPRRPRARARPRPPRRPAARA